METIPVPASKLRILESILSGVFPAEPRFADGSSNKPSVLGLIPLFESRYGFALLPVSPLEWRTKTERLGVDVAGEIIAVGRKVAEFKLGDAVFGTRKDAFAEYVCASEAKLAPKPESVSFEQAASVPIAGLTVLQALRDKERLQLERKLLINGAAGGVGTFAVQIAKSFGANVTMFVARKMSSWCVPSVPDFVLLGSFCTRFVG